jgi:shikimate dehydrogenase
MQSITVNGETKLVGLIGWPVKHSLSPVMHNAAFAKLGLNWAYVPLPVEPNKVQPAMQGLTALNFKGVNVTIPHKQAVIRYVDELSNAATITGAVNTIHINHGKFYGYNTDAIGFLNSLLEKDCSPKGMRVAVLGAGGAARAVVYALCRAEAEAVTVFNRTAERAAFLVDDLADAFPDSQLQFAPLTRDALRQMDNNVDLVVNTTSVGMAPHLEKCPWPDDVPMSPRATFCDLIYNPLQTIFLRRAEAAGAKIIDGLGMLVHQGAYAFTQWSGHEAPIDVMRQACLASLGYRR